MRPIVPMSIAQHILTIRPVTLQTHTKNLYSSDTTEMSIQTVIPPQFPPSNTYLCHKGRRGVTDRNPIVNDIRRSQQEPGSDPDVPKYFMYP